MSFGRRAEVLVKTYFIALDDIGTKVDPAKIKLPPTIKDSKTSPNNFQYHSGWRRASNPQEAEALINALIDRGADRPSDQPGRGHVRLPGSINEKACAEPNL